MNKKNFITIFEKTSVREAIKKLDTENLNSLCVIDKNGKMVGVFTDGDFRRSVLAGLDISKEVSPWINKDFKYLFNGCSENQIKEIFISNVFIRDLPILNKKFKIIKVIKREDVLTSSELRKENLKLKNIPVVVMAGGKGTRMDPFTRVLPKPLIPIGNEPIIKKILDQFREFDVKNFYISIYEKGEMIKAYFNSYKKNYNIKYIEEEKPLGTIGALSLIRDKLKKTFFVTNCDILIEHHYPSIFEFHRKNKYDLTLAASLRDFSIPYGVCDVDINGKLLSMNEKPHYNFLVNTGLYIIEPRVLKLIPNNKLFNINDLITEIKKNNMRTGVYPISDKSWLDLGNWNEYSNVLDKKF
tara:strand:- start:900 stop:1967 length:1068 start_codon:yes stop_codon:yes gene_type:complete